MQLNTWPSHLFGALSGDPGGNIGVSEAQALRYAVPLGLLTSSVGPRVLSTAPSA